MDGLRPWLTALFNTGHRHTHPSRRLTQALRAPPPPQDILQEYYPKALLSELALYLNRSLIDLHYSFPNTRFIHVDNLLSFGQVGSWCMLRAAKGGMLIPAVQQLQARCPGHISPGDRL